MRWGRWVMGTAMGLAVVCPGLLHAEDAAQEPVVSVEPSEVEDMVAAEGPAPSVEEAHRVISDYVTQVEQEEGAFTIEDDVTEQTRTLVLERLHDQVSRSGFFYYVCADMKDPSTGETLDVDFDVEVTPEGVELADIQIHAVNGQPRYTYNELGDRVD